jgi:hypothetical protein
VGGGHRLGDVELAVEARGTLAEGHGDVEQLHTLEAVGRDIGLEEAKAFRVRLERHDPGTRKALLEPGDRKADVTPAVQDDGVAPVAGEAVLAALEDLAGHELELGLIAVLKGEPGPLGGVGLHGSSSASRCIGGDVLISAFPGGSARGASRRSTRIVDS